jgi:hypothetical protein
MDLKQAVEIARKKRPLGFDALGEHYEAKDLLIDTLITRHPRLLDVLLERERQITEEGWTPEHDDRHSAGELAWAGSCYAGDAHDYVPGEIPWSWPWAAAWWKPSPDPQRNLAKAAALILAEQERLDRLASRKEVSRG